MKAILLAIILFMGAAALGQGRTKSVDTEWEKQGVVLTNTLEAGFIIRVGDVDNLNFGWPDGFDPFCGRMTEPHAFPWDINEQDIPGMDRILLSSRYNPAGNLPCGGDGYSGSFDKAKSKPATWQVPTEALQGATISNAYLQIFIDDFQSPSFCSYFHLFLNGKRFIEGEKMLNAIDQTGPVGKLISIPLTEDWYAVLGGGKGLSVLIDESKGAADGFAVDFIRLLVNRKRENSCKGSIKGLVLIKDTETPVANARVYTAENESVSTNSKGEFILKNIPAGFEVVYAAASGFTDGSSTADVGEGDENPPVTIFLEKGRSANFNNKAISVGESITLNAILFDQGKADLRPESKPELDKLAAFLQANPGAEIELSGHTSSEGERSYNRSLSYRRVKACKDYLVVKGIPEDRVIAIGFGPDRPVAPNDTEANRAKNRRVEMRLKKL